MHPTEGTERGETPIPVENRDTSSSYEKWHPLPAGNDTVREKYFPTRKSLTSQRRIVQTCEGTMRSPVSRSPPRPGSVNNPTSRTALDPKKVFREKRNFARPPLRGERRAWGRQGRARALGARLTVRNAVCACHLRARSLSVVAPGGEWLFLVCAPVRLSDESRPRIQHRTTGTE